MNKRYKIVTNGELRDGINPDTFIIEFSRTFKVSEERARALLGAESTITLKDNIDLDTANKYRSLLANQMGLVVRIEELSNSVPVNDSVHGGEVSNISRTCPKCGSEQLTGDDCLSCGIIISRYLARQKSESEKNASSIYAAPTTKLLRDRGEVADGAAELRSVSAESGLNWIVGGWKFFVKNPLAWIMTTIIWFVLLYVGKLIPVVGIYVVNTLSPIFIAGFMLGASEQNKGGDFSFVHLFAGFTTRFNKLIVVGLLYMLASLIVEKTSESVVLSYGLSAVTRQGMASALNGGGIIAVLLAWLLFFLAVMAIISMAFWYVPLLVVFDGINPVRSIGMSFKACSKNALPFLLYALIGLGLAIVSIIPIGLGLLVFVPVMVASIYVSYRDIFHGEN